MAYQGTGIVNPIPNGTPDCRVMADLDKEHWNYFFRGVFVGKRGPRQALICTFFKKFKEACLEAKIEPIWEIDNEERVNEILQRLNFNPPVSIPPASKPKRKAKNGTS
jgi:hypothetical protein